jgi:tagatose 6-phosphate kinase
MFLIVNLNPAVDRIYALKNFKLNEIHRTEEVLAQAGGKGINVARASNILGGNAIVTGILGGHSGNFILENLDKSGINHDFHVINRESRTCIILIDCHNSSQTVINEDGPVLADAEIDAFIKKFSSIISKFKLLVISGSVPNSIKRNIYPELIKIARQNNVPSIVDTSKMALKKSINEKPL